MVYEDYNQLKENIKHGDYMLPIAEYGTEIPKNFSSFPMHWHEEMEIIKVHSGQFEVNINLKSYIVKAGEIVIIPPCTLHSFKQHEDNEMSSQSILFNMRLLGENIPDACTVKYLTPFTEGEYNYYPIIKKSDEGYNEILNDFENLVFCFKEKRNYFELQLKSILFKLQFDLFTFVLTKDGSRSEIKSEVINNIKIILEEIKENYSEQISIDDLAKKLNFSKSHFMHYFKKHMGITCVEYINEYRLNIAAKLLVSTDMTITEIANKVGIENCSYFNRLFKRAFDVSPSEHRKNGIK